MVPRPAQDLPIEHRTGLLPLFARPHVTDDTESVGQWRVGRERGEHSMFLTALEHPPHGVRSADQSRRLELPCLLLDGVPVEFDDDVRGRGHAGGIGGGSVGQVHHRPSTRCRGGNP